MEKDLEAKIKVILEKGSNISEDEVRSLMGLIRESWSRGGSGDEITR